MAFCGKPFAVYKYGCGAMVAYRSPKPLMGVRISPPVRMNEELRVQNS